MDNIITFFNKKTVVKLREAGCKTLNDFMAMTPAQIVEVPKITVNEIRACFPVQEMIKTTKTITELFKEE